MKLIIGGVVLDKLVEDFARRFPKLETKSGAFGKCKMLSFELALYLRRRGVQAKLIHVQNAQKKEWKATAHSKWTSQPQSGWSHYVVQVGSTVIDITGRQLDAKAEHPRIFTRAELNTEWATVENDVFLNGIVKEVLVSQMDANRQTREGRVQKVDITPASTPGKPQQQRLRSSPA